MLASSIPTAVKLAGFPHVVPSTRVELVNDDKAKLGSRRSTLSSSLVGSRQYYHLRSGFFGSKVLYPTRVTNGEGGGATEYTQQESGNPDVEESNQSSPSYGDSYVALFVRMLGLDHDSLDREQAIVALWKYSLGGKKCIDAIMQFHGCLNLTVNLLGSESSSMCEAAAGLLRSISSVNLYRESVAKSGAVEEITGLLTRPSLTPEVKEQSICTLWNLSVDEKLRPKIADTALLPLIIRSLDDEDIKVQEAAGGVLANLALTHSNHQIMIEAGIIPKLAKLLESDAEGSKIVKKEARNALLELAKDEYYRILIIEEGLVPVPLIGSAAYKSFKPGLYSWPSLPDGTEIERTSKGPSRFGASELLLGLNVDKNMDLEEAKIKAIVGRNRQQFLARVGAIELEIEGKSKSGLTLLPWMDGVARLVLILEVGDEMAISRAAECIADACINEHMRVSFKEAGAVKHLVWLLSHDNTASKSSIISALNKLSISQSVCQRIEAEGVIVPLVDILKQSQISDPIIVQALDLLNQILDPNTEMKYKFYEEPISGSTKDVDATTQSNSTRKYMLDTTVTARLVDIVKMGSPDLQRKSLLILECITVMDPTMNSMITEDLLHALEYAFRQKTLKDREFDVEAEEPEKHAIEVEEAGCVISAASKLLTKLLESVKFRRALNLAHFTNLLREILKSNIPVYHKDWVAASLVKMNSWYGHSLGSNSAINTEVTLYETIPRLIEQINSSSPESKEAAVMELNRIISEGVVDPTYGVAAQGGIEPLVKLLEGVSEKASEASLALLYILSMNSENHAAMVRAGVVPVLRRIVVLQRPHWTRALRLLRNLPI